MIKATIISGKEITVSVRTRLGYVWKLPLCALVFDTGIGVGVQMAWLLRLPLVLGRPLGLSGEWRETVMLWLFLLGLPFVLSFVAQQIGGRFVSRWLALSALSYITSAAQYGVKGAVLSSTEPAQSTFVPFYWMMYAPACIGMAAVLAALFPPSDEGPRFTERAWAFFATHPIPELMWRLPLGVLAFVAIAFALSPVLGRDVRLPSLGANIALAAVRGVLLTLAPIPTLILWNSSWRALVLALGCVLFVLGGGISGFTVYSILILIGALAHAWVLATLFMPSERLIRRMKVAESHSLPSLSGEELPGSADDAGTT